MLEFKELIKWIYATDDIFLKKRAGAISARAKLVNSINANEVNYKDIREIIEYDRQIEEHNVEQLSAKLLFDLTRNTGFEFQKEQLEHVGLNHAANGENVKKMISVDWMISDYQYWIK